MSIPMAFDDIDGVTFRGATDLKLGRSVAIKLLPTTFASDPERLSRFRRGAQVLASLNHPNIAHIYGLEESGETRCIVMELVEGETLQSRLSGWPLLKLGSTLEAGVPHELFQLPGNRVQNRIVETPDGQRFLIPLAAQAAERPARTAVLNWTTGIKK